MNEYGTAPLDEFAVEPEIGTIVYMSDSGDGQGEELLNEIFANTTQSVYNDPITPTDFSRAMVLKSAYGPSLNDRKIEVYNKEQEAAIEIEDADVFIINNFQHYERSQTPVEIMTKMAVLKQKITENSAIGLLRSIGETSTPTTEVVKNICDIIAAIEIEKEGLEQEYLFTISKNRGGTPMESYKPIQFRESIEIDTRRNIS